MGRKKHQQGRPDKRKGVPGDLRSFDRRAMERSMRDVDRALRGRKFDSIEEVNALLQEMLASGAPAPQDAPTPVEQAQDVMYAAWEASGKKRVQLARRALAISEDCADAYVLLAEETARSIEEATHLYEQGVRAGERALGAEAFTEEVGNFWGILETRPYMRARLGLAQCLWLQGKRAQAIEHLQDMLRLNPNDNQGIRWILANYLVEENRDKELGALLRQYDGENSATWHYTKALWLFRREGASTKANAALESALASNEFVPFYLLGLEDLPQEPPPYFSPGEASEAVCYAFEAIYAWAATEGAIEWLASADSEALAEGRRIVREELIKAVERQVRTNDPPATGATLKRLQEAGYSRRDAVMLIGGALAEEMWYIMREQKPFDAARYKRLLDALE